MQHYSFQVSMNDRLMYDGIVACRDKSVAEKTLRDHYKMGELGTVNLIGIVPHLSPTFIIE